MMLILMLKTYGNVVWSACLIADTKPKLKNHYRAHRLSFWLNLVPDLHRPGGQDIPPSHHLLNSQDEADTSQRSYFPSLPKSIWPGISSLTPGGTAVPNAAHGFNLTAAAVSMKHQPPPDPGGGGGPHHHHHHHQQQQTQLPPPEFADVLPAAHYYHPHHHHAATLPRPPPPPKMAPPPELVAGTPPGIMITAGGTLQRPRIMHIEQPDAKNANTATLKKSNLHGKVSQLANSIDELRV
jgi:hypothetical protein